MGGYYYLVSASSKINETKKKYCCTLNYITCTLIFKIWSLRVTKMHDQKVRKKEFKVVFCKTDRLENRENRFLRNNARIQRETHLKKKVLFSPKNINSLL